MYFLCVSACTAVHRRQCSAFTALILPPVIRIGHIRAHKGQSLPTMPDRRRNRARNWIRGIIPQATASRAPTSTTFTVDSHPPDGAPIDPVLPSSTSPPSGKNINSQGIQSTITTDSAIDNLALVLNLVQQVMNVVQKVPFVAPVAAAMSEILKAYKVCFRFVGALHTSSYLLCCLQEVKDTNEKRDVLFAQISAITRDLCATILRMEETNHVDLLGRLKGDLETYAGLALFFSSVVDNLIADTDYFRRLLCSSGSTITTGNWFIWRHATNSQAN